MAFARLVKSKFPKAYISGSIHHASKKKLLEDQPYDRIVMDCQGVLQTDEKYDKILELVGAATIKNSFDHIREAGIICSTGQLGNQWHLEEFDPIMEIKNNSFLTSFYSGNVSQEKLNELFAFHL